MVFIGCDVILAKYSSLIIGRSARDIFIFKQAGRENELLCIAAYARNIDNTLVCIERVEISCSAFFKGPQKGADLKWRNRR